MFSSFSCVLVLLVPAATASSGYPRGDLLLEVNELARPAAAQKYRILDARSQDKYRAGHIPGAVWVNHNAWAVAFAADQDQKEWSRRIGELGITLDTPVVVYDDNYDKEAARIWWILRYWGVRDVRLLNGGWLAWKAADGLVSRELPETATVKVQLAPHADRLATKDQILAGLPSNQFQIVDARSEGEFCGDEQTAKRNGAIPGAKNLEWKDLLDPQTQKFKSPQELSRLFQAAGIDLKRPTVTHCQSGGRASVMAFGLELMGARQVRNYYHSWAEWGNAADTPVVKPKKG